MAPTMHCNKSQVRLQRQREVFECGDRERFMFAASDCGGEGKSGNVESEAGCKMENSAKAPPA